MLQSPTRIKICVINALANIKYSKRGCFYEIKGKAEAWRVIEKFLELAERRYPKYYSKLQDTAMK